MPLLSSRPINTTNDVTIDRPALGSETEPVSVKNAFSEIILSSQSSAKVALIPLRAGEDLNFHATPARARRAPYNINLHYLKPRSGKLAHWARCTFCRACARELSEAVNIVIAVKRTVTKSYVFFARPGLSAVRITP